MITFQLVGVGIIMNLMIIFEVPIIAVLYVWCQLNKGIYRVNFTLSHEP